MSGRDIRLQAMLPDEGPWRLRLWRGHVLAFSRKSGLYYFNRADDLKIAHFLRVEIAIKAAEDAGNGSAGSPSSGA
jgi:hypothetical protein